MMSTCNRLDLPPLGSQPISMPKNLPDHWCELTLLDIVQLDIAYHLFDIKDVYLMYKEWFNICAMFSRDGVDGMKRNASKSNPPTCIVKSSLLDLSIKLFYFVFECIQDGELNGTQKWSPSGVKHDLCGQSPHVAYHYNLFGQPILQSFYLDPHKNHSTPSLLHQQWLFTISRFSTLGTCNLVALSHKYVASLSMQIP
jgi:hypothetical protein